MSDAPALRRLLVVDPCDDCHQLLPGLRSVGWDVDSCTLENATDRTCDVGLLRLQPWHLEHPDAVKEVISRSGTEWIAVLRAVGAILPARWVSRRYGDYHCSRTDRIGKAIVWGPSAGH